MIQEALGAEETDLVKEGHVFKVYKKAYKLHDKIIRPAQVIVAKAVTKPN
jgi:molecular chaperone GrpE